MIKQYELQREKLVLAFIMVISAVMRFYNYGSWGYSNDELSALYGVVIGKEGGFHEMIDEYVRTDFHPAGIQVLIYYWVKLFGTMQEAIVRLPFVIAGIASVYFTYLVAAKWFNRTTGLFVAATFSFLEYTILYSQLARPYSFGLLFSLVAVYCWTCILFDPPGRRRLLLCAGWALSLAGCMYTHYFSFLFAIMTGATGLLYLKKHNYLAYLVPPVIAVLIYLPHISIALEQFGRGGVGTWLSKPEKDYFFKYISYCFNDSVLLSAVIAVIVIAGLFLNRSGVQRNKFRTISLVWFFVPFLIGYFYSVYVNPVLQYSILLFSFPFLLIFLFSFFDPLRKKQNTILLAVLMAAGIFSTVIEKKFYSTQFFGVFKEIAQKTSEWDKKYGRENVTQTVDVIVPWYIDHYLAQYNESDSPNGYAMYDTETGKLLGQLKAIIDSTDTEYFIHGWSNKWNPYDTYELIKQKYPVVVEDHRYFNSGVTLFKKGPPRKPLLDIFNDFESAHDYWQPDSLYIVHQPAHSGANAYLMDSLTEFSPALSSTVEQLYKGSEFVVITAWAYYEKDNDAMIVISFEGDVKDWAGARIADFVKPGQWGQVLLTRKRPQGVKLTDPVKIYIWKPGGKNIVIDDMKLRTYADSDYSY